MCKAEVFYAISCFSRLYTFIQNNYLNLSGKITQNSKVTDYIYRADGVKVRKVFGTETTDYLDGFQYMNSVLKFFPTAEGYFNVETGKYVYNYTDHLGNTRLSYAKSGAGTEIIEESNYYPFGLKHEGYNILTGNLAYKYKYNGKELQETGMYDYGFRNYMPELGRWLTQDPLSELAPGWNSYRYAYDNPLRYIDPKGLFESRKEARRYRKENGLEGSIKRQKDGTYAINDRENRISYSKGDDSKLTESDTHDNDGVIESVLIPKAPYGPKDSFDLTTTDVSLFENTTWKTMSTAQKSKFVWDAKKFIKTTTGIKIPGSTSSWYRTKLPKTMKGIGIAGGIVAGGVVVYDVLDSKTVKASNILDVAVTGVSFVPGWGWIVGGVFFGADMVTKGVTGQSIGDHLDNYIEENFDKDDGALIDWSKK